MFKFLLALASATDTNCPFPQVQMCWKAPKKTCWEPLKNLDVKTDAALKALGSGYYDKIGTLLMHGKEFNETFAIHQDSDNVYLTAYSFEKIGFEEDIQIHVTNLEILSSQDQKFAVAASDLINEFQEFTTECIDKKHQYAG